MNKIDEKELKELFSELKTTNKKESFETLYKKYNKLVYKIAFTILKNKEDSEDIVQAVFSKIYSLPKEKIPIDNIATWIYSVTKNEAISLYRKRKSTVNLDNMYEISDNDNEINRIVDQDIYNKILSRLNDREKEIVSLKVLTNLTFEEVAKILGKPTGTVKWRYYKSIHTLKLLISNLGMFIITFVIGLKTMKKDAKEVKSEQSLIQENNQDSINNQNRTESMLHEETKSKDTEDLYKTENTTNQTNETKEEIQIPVNEPTTNINYYSIGVLAVSSIFLLFTIIFLINFIKYQLKRKLKTSK